MATTKNVKGISGINVYQTEDGRIVYCGMFSNKAYVFSNKDANKYHLLTNRFVPAAGLGSLVGVVTKNSILSIVIFVAIYIGLLLIFRYSFLEKLPVIENFEKPKKDDYITMNAKDFGYIRLIVLVLLGLALGTIFLTNLINAEERGQIFLLYSLAIVFGYGFAILNILTITRKIKINNNAG